MNDETMDELNADEATVTNLRNFAAEKTAERAAAKGLPGLMEWVFTGEVR